MCVRPRFPIRDAGNFQQCVADKLSFLSLEVRSCDIVHVTAVEAKDCLRATDHVPTGSVTQRSITLAYNGLHLPHSRTNTPTSRKAEHEQRVKARVKSTCNTLAYLAIKASISARNAAKLCSGLLV